MNSDGTQVYILSSHFESTPDFVDIGKETKLELAKLGGVTFSYSTSTAKYNLEPGSQEALDWLKVLQDASSRIWETQGARTIVDILWKN